jgi:hypothetical protein
MYRNIMKCVRLWLGVKSNPRSLTLIHYMICIFVYVIYGCSQNFIEKVAQFSMSRITKLGANGIHSLEGANGTRKKIGGYFWTRCFERSA